MSFDVYVNERHAGVLSEAGKATVFTYLPDVPSDCLVSLLMPVRAESYKWSAGLLPYFQMNLPEGYKKDLIRQRLGPHADVSDLGLLALTGANGIGRVKVVPRGIPLSVGTSNIDMAGLLASADSRENLLMALESGITEGVSGVMPKAFAHPTWKVTTWTEEYVLKTGLPDLPGLSVNEYLCLEVARQASLDVPEARLSDDGQVLAVKRFDVLSDGRRRAVEDYCSLKGLDPVNKYKGTLEDLEKLSRAYIPSSAWRENARRLYLLLLVNYAVRNADAHLKNFAVTYESPKDVSLAPVYDIVTVNAYSRFASQIPALALAGKRVWASGTLLNSYASSRLGLSAADRERCVESIIEAVRTVAPRVDEYAERFPEFRQIGKPMLDAWAVGIEDIKATARPRKRAVQS
jgi:serine/threonine-protein kinase HipA